MRWLWRLGGFAVGATVVALLVRALGVRHVADEIARVRWGFLAVLGAYLASNLVYAVPLGVLLAGRARVRARDLVAGRLAAVAVNAATPFLGVGGEPARLLWLAPGDRRLGTAAIVVDRSAFLAASALFLVAGAALALGLLALPTAVRVGVGAAAVLAPVGVYVLYRRQRGAGLARPVARLFGPLAGRRREFLVDGAADVDARVRELHDAHPHGFPAAVAIHLAGRLVSSLEAWAIARALGLDVGLAGALILTAVPLALDAALSIIPSQIGVNEGVLALLVAAMGHDAAAGVALALVQRLRQVVFVALGFALLTLRRPATARAPERTSAPVVR